MAFAMTAEYALTSAHRRCAAQSLPTAGSAEKKDCRVRVTGAVAEVWFPRVSKLILLLRFGDLQSFSHVIKIQFSGMAALNLGLHGNWQSHLEIRVQK